MASSSQEMLFQHAGHRFKEKILPRIMPQVDCENPAHQQWMDDTYLRFKKYYQQAQKALSRRCGHAQGAQASWLYPLHRQQ